MEHLNSSIPACVEHDFVKSLVLSFLIKYIYIYATSKLRKVNMCNAYSYVA